MDRKEKSVGVNTDLCVERGMTLLRIRNRVVSGLWRGVDSLVSFVAYFRMRRKAIVCVVLLLKPPTKSVAKNNSKRLRHIRGKKKRDKSRYCDV